MTPPVGADVDDVENFRSLPCSRRKAILDTVIEYLRDRPENTSMTVTVDEIAHELPLAEMAVAGAMTHLQSHGPYTVRRDDLGGEVGWMVTGKLN